MMNLKMVTWDGDLTQFLVETDTDVKAIRKALEANLMLGDCAGAESEMHDLTSYTVENVDFNLLAQILMRTDCRGRYAEAVVFND